MTPTVEVSTDVPGRKRLSAQVECVNPLTDSRWDCWLGRFSEANCFHSSGWLRVLADAYGHHVRGFVLRDGQEIRGIVPMVVGNSRWLGRRAACVGFADIARPLAKDLQSYRAIQEAVLEHGAAQGWKTVEFRGGREWLPEAPAATAYWEHELEISRDEGVMFSSLDGATRRNIRKAERANLRVDFSQSPGAIAVYYDLHCRTRRRLGSPPQPRLFFEHIGRHLISRDAGFIALAYHGDIPVAGVVVLTHGAQAIYKFGAADERYQHLRPSNLVMWEAIKRCASLGFQTYHFGRTSLHDVGLRRFKQGWGCKERLLEYFCIDLPADGFVRKLDQANSWAAHLISRLPIPVVRALGAVLYPHLI